MTRPMAEWDPAQYLRFGGERLRPALDLLAQVPLDTPARVTDLGCGPGNVTTVLRGRFPQADIIGVDGSAAMLEKARAAAPDCRFELADFFAWRPPGPVDLIFSNAALHWVDRHATLFPRLLSFLAPRGVLAVQMPVMQETPLHRVAREIAASDEWAGLLGNVVAVRGTLPIAEYWDLLRPRVASLDIWQTTYTHALSGENAVLEWASGSSLRPYLDRLADEPKQAFRQAYAEAVGRHYPRRPDGTTILPFHRMFLVARIAPATAP
jgi:trans-aconitate 2-methyltransferase